MKEILINQIVPIIVAGIVATLVKVVAKIGEEVIPAIAKFKEEKEQKIILNGHEKELTLAREIFNIVEEKFRITENASTVLGNKMDMFDGLLLEKIPGLTKEELADLRQAIAGEFNKGKQAITDVTQLQQVNSQLSQENATLKATISQIQSTVGGAQ